ncbi:hypothetical protein INR49_032796, partial [Caranx melampygus]
MLPCLPLGEEMRRATDANILDPSLLPDSSPRDRNNDGVNERVSEERGRGGGGGGGGGGGEHICRSQSELLISLGPLQLHITIRQHLISKPVNASSSEESRLKDTQNPHTLIALVFGGDELIVAQAAGVFLTADEGRESPLALVVLRSAGRATAFVQVSRCLDGVGKPGSCQAGTGYEASVQPISSAEHRAGQEGFGSTLGAPMDMEACCEAHDDGAAAAAEEQSQGGVVPLALCRPKRERKQRSYTLCEVCNIQLNSAAQAQIHYNGKSHQKRLKQISNGKTPGNTSTVLPTVATPPPQMPSARCPPLCASPTGRTPQFKLWEK